MKPKPLLFMVTFILCIFFPFNTRCSGLDVSYSEAGNYFPDDSLYTVCAEYYPGVQLMKGDSDDISCYLLLEFNDSNGHYYIEYYQDKQTPYCYYCMYFGDIERYCIPGKDRLLFFETVNSLNNKADFPTVSLSDEGYIYGYDVLHFSDETTPTDLVPFYDRCSDNIAILFHAIEKAGLSLSHGSAQNAAPDTGDAAASAPTLPPATSAPTPPPNPAPNSNFYVEYVYEDVTCFNCHGSGICPLCSGTGTYRMYGQSVPCDRKCSTCGGAGSYKQLVPKYHYN